MIAPHLRLLAILLVASPVHGALAPGDHRIELRHGGLDRWAIVHVPPQATRDEPLPLLMAFHGGGGEPAGFQAYAGLDRIADREGIVVAYPAGTGPFRDRLLTFDAGACCGRAAKERVDDVGFTRALVAEIGRRMKLDPRRTWATGHSNGAMMCWRLAIEAPDLVAAIAPVAGAASLPHRVPSRPVPVLHVHSADDPRALYAGGLGPPFPLTNVKVVHQPVMPNLERWARDCGCSGPPAVVKTVTGAQGTESEGHRAQLLRWSGCPDGIVVEHWRMTGPGHGWPGHVAPGRRERLIGPSTRVIDAAEEVVAFVTRFAQPAPKAMTP